MSRFSERSRTGRLDPASDLVSTRSLVMHVLAQEAGVGFILYAAAGRRTLDVLGAGFVAWLLLTLWARRNGMIPPRSWLTACLEGMVLMVGAVCIANLLRLGFGPAGFAAP